MTAKRFRVCVVTTHPIQYQAPLWRKLAESRDVDPTVVFLSRHGADRGIDPSFEVEFAWDVPLLEGYRHLFLSSVSLPGVFRKKTTRWGPTGALVATGLTKLLKDGGFDAVFVQGYASGAAWGGALAAWRSGVPVIVRGESHDRGRKRNLWQAVRRQVVSLWLGRINMVIAIGRLNRDFWRGLGVPDERILLSTYAVDNDRFRRTIEIAPERARELRESWGAETNDVVFLFSGKLTPVKAPEVLLEAFAGLPADARAHLVFVGTGPLEEQLRALERRKGTHRVHWAGFVNQSEIPHYYSAADALVLPSRVEPWGLVVNEAMACGTPCIVSDMVGAGPDLVETFAAGSVFPANDSEALQKCLEDALDPVRRRAWSAGLDGFCQRVSLDGNVDCITAAVETVSAGRFPAPSLVGRGQEAEKP